MCKSKILAAFAALLITGTFVSGLGQAAAEAPRWPGLMASQGLAEASTILTRRLS